VQRASGIPCSLLLRDNETQTSGVSRREKVAVYPLFEIRITSHNVIARSVCDEAIQLPCLLHESWIASLRSQ
jgi:hypothetical protein